MSRLLSSLSILALCALPALAQETTAPAEGEAPADEAPAEAQPDLGLSLGEPVAPDGGAVGAPYVKEEHGDWDVRCIRTASGNDPCQVYQLLVDAEGNSVAEFAIFPLVPAQGQAVAGGSIISPLETLLTEQVTVSIDGSGARRYPFTFCTEIGCFARIGYTAEDVTRFKRGMKATVSIVPAVAPDQRIALELSLRGFTAAFDSLEAQMKEAAGQ